MIIRERGRSLAWGRKMRINTPLVSKKENIKQEIVGKEVEEINHHFTMTNMRSNLRVTIGAKISQAQHSLSFGFNMPAKRIKKLFNWTMEKTAVLLNSSLKQRNHFSLASFPNQNSLIYFLFSFGTVPFDSDCLHGSQKERVQTGTAPTVLM